MRWISYAVCLCVVAVQLGYTMPVAEEAGASSLAKETLQTIDKELGNPTAESSEREKRTVGVFRRIFPELSKIIDDKIQQITRVVFRVVGRAVLGGGLGGGGGGGGGGGEGGDGETGRRISITLPTYPPDPEDEEDTEEPSETDATPDASSGDDNLIPAGNEDSDATQTEGRAEDSALSEAASEVKEVRVPYVPSESENDLQAAASGEDNEEAESSQEEISDDIDISESEDSSRSKRLGVFGNLFGGGGAGGGASGGGGSGGGSGNFLFDIIRRTADGAARAAGSVYRLVAGTDDLGLAGYANELTVPTVAIAMAAQAPATAAAPPPPSPPPPPPPPAAKPNNRTLVAGSGATEQQDENANAPVAPPADGAPAQPADDGYQAGIPGPITRLFVIANRGIANLIQDLILRLAQTSERIVNFKARLITAII